MRKIHSIATSALKFRSLLDKNKCGLYIHEYQAYDLLKRYQLPLVPVKFLLVDLAIKAMSAAEPSPTPRYSKATAPPNIQIFFPTSERTAKPRMLTI